MSVLDYADIIDAAARRNDVHPELLAAMMGQESGGKPGAVSPKGARGLMQLMPGTAQRFGVKDIHDPVQNIEGGAKYMRWLLDRFNGNVPLALAGYNAGEGAVDKYKGVPPYKETQHYVKTIFGKFARMASSLIPEARAEDGPSRYEVLESPPNDAADAPRYEIVDAVRRAGDPDARYEVIDAAPARYGEADATDEGAGTLSKIGKTAALLPSSVKAAAGGLMRASGDAMTRGVNQTGWLQALSPFGAIANADSDIGRDAKHVIESGGEWLSSAGSAVAEPSVEALGAAPRGDGPVEQFVLDVAAGARDLVPVLAAGVVGGPGAAAAVAGAQTYGATYARLTKSGLAEGKAASKATSDAIINGAGALIPVGIFLKAAGPLRSRILKSVGVNAPISAIQSGLQQAYDGDKVGFDAPLSSVLGNMIYDVGVGSVSLGMAEAGVGLGRRGITSEKARADAAGKGELLADERAALGLTAEQPSAPDAATKTAEVASTDVATAPRYEVQPAPQDALSQITESLDAAYTRLQERYPAQAEKIIGAVDWSAKDNGDSMRRALAEMTAFEAKSPEQVLAERKEPRTLAKAIRDRGGINAIDMPDILGESKITPETTRGMPKGLFKRQGGRSLDDLVVNMWEDGYLPSPDADPRQLVTMLQDELSGRQRYYSAHDQEAVDAYLGWRRETDEANKPPQARTGRLADEMNAPPVKLTEEINPALLGRMPARVHKEMMVDPATGQEVPKYAGNANLETLDSSEAVFAHIRRAAADDAAQVRRRGVVEHEQTKQLASDIGLTVEGFLKTPIGRASNAHELHAARQLWLDSATALEQATTAAENGDVRAALALEQQIQRFSLLNATYQGAVSEAGRALNILKARVNLSRSPQELQELLTELSSSGDTAHKIALLKEAFQRAKETGSNAPIAAAAKKLASPSWAGRVAEASLAFKFSNPLSHMANIIGNAAMGLHEGAVQVAAAGLGKLHGGDKVTVRDASQFVGALLDPGLWGNALRDAGRTFMTEQATGLTKTEGHMPSIGGVTGRIIRVPLRALQAEDQYFKHIFRYASARQQAERLAIQRGLNGPEKQTFIESIMDRPTDLGPETGDRKTIWEKADNDAARLTFNEALGEIGQKISSARHVAMRHDPVSALITTTLLPTLRTPINIFKQAVRNSALAPLTRDSLADLRGRNGKGARDVLLARWGIGSLLTIQALALAKSGLITGAAPTDPGEREAFEAAGKIPYAVKLGDQWVEYRRYDPYSSVLGISANLVQSLDRMGKKDAEAAVTALAMGTAKSVIDKSFLSGMMSFFQAVADPERYGEAFVANQVGGLMMPYSGAHGFIGGKIDPFYREADGIIERAKARYGMGQSLPHKINPLTGEPKKRPAQLLGVLPSAVTEELGDPVVIEVNRLTGRGLLRGVSPPSKTVPAGPLSREQMRINPHAYERMARLRGKAVNAVLSRLFASPAYRGLPDEMRAMAVQRIIPEISSAAKSAAGVK